MSALVIGLGSLAAALGLGMRKVRSKSREYEYDRDLYRADAVRYEAEIDALRERLAHAKDDVRATKEQLLLDHATREVEVKINARDERLKSARTAADAIRARTGGRP
jgi:hypothetical protein